MTLKVCGSERFRDHLKHEQSEQICKLCNCSMKFHSINTDMIVRSLELSRPGSNSSYNCKENVAFPDGAAEFGGGLQWPMP